MGKWAKIVFGKEKIGEIGIVVAGAIKPRFEKKILNFFDRIVSSSDRVYHAHLVKKDGLTYPIIFNIYGAPAMVDVLTEMHDGGCRTIIFVGSAYGGFKNLEVGSIVVPDESYHFEGIYKQIEPSKIAETPDGELKKRLKEILSKNDVRWINGTNISVPAVTLQLPHNNREYKKIKPSTVEMELSAFYSRSKEMGIRAAGVLIISDNRGSSMGDMKKKEIRFISKTRVIKTIVDNIENLKLPKLKTKKEFNIDEHLASIIEDPDDITNVYRKK